MGVEGFGGGGQNENIKHSCEMQSSRNMAFSPSSVGLNEYSTFKIQSGVEEVGGSRGEIHNTMTIEIQR